MAGRELSGRAQARRRAGSFQPGSMPLIGDLTRITQVLVFSSPADRVFASERLLQRATTLETSTGRVVSFADAASAFITGFEQALHLHLQPGELTESEQKRALELDSLKYSHTSWTNRV